MLFSVIDTVHWPDSRLWSIRLKFSRGVDAFSLLAHWHHQATVPYGVIMKKEGMNISRSSKIHSLTFVSRATSWHHSDPHYFCHQGHSYKNFSCTGNTRLHIYKIRLQIVVVFCVTGIVKPWSVATSRHLSQINNVKWNPMWLMIPKPFEVSELKSQGSHKEYN